MKGVPHFVVPGLRFEILYSQGKGGLGETRGSGWRQKGQGGQKRLGVREDKMVRRD